MNDEPNDGCIETLKRWILYAVAIIGSIFGIQ
jgi:hypothetical protein